MAKATTGTKEATTATKEATAATKEATDATKKYVDIQETRGKLTEHRKELEDAKQVYQERIKLYDLEIINAGESLEKRKELEKEKNEYIKQNAADIIRIQKELTAAEKQEQDLSITQWTQHAQKIGEINDQVKQAMGKVTDYLGQGFTAVTEVYKAEIAAIDEDLKLAKMNVEAVKNDATKSTNAITVLEAEQKAATEQGQIEKAKQLQTEIDYHKGIVATKAEYDNKVNELDQKKAKKQIEQEKLDKIRRKLELVKNIAEATSNVAQGVTKTMGAYPFPFNLALAATVAVAGAFQIKTMTAQLAKFADGGLLNGKRHSQGGMRIEGSNIEVEGGEYVVNRESTSKNLGLVRYINSERRELKPADLNAYFNSLPRVEVGGASFRRMFQDGGQLPIAEPTANIDNETLVQAIQSIRIEPRVAVSDIHRVQDSMVSVDSWTGV